MESNFRSSVENHFLFTEKFVLIKGIFFSIDNNAHIFVSSKKFCLNIENCFLSKFTILIFNTVLMINSPIHFVRTRQ